MSSKIDYPTWVASKLPDVTYAPDAGGVWRYWRALKFQDEIGEDAEYRLKAFEPGEGWDPYRPEGYTHVPSLDPEYGDIRRPIPRPTERLLEAMRDGRDSENAIFRCPVTGRQSPDGLDMLTACEHSCQPEPGDGKPVPQEMGEAVVAEAIDKLYAGPRVSAELYIRSLAQIEDLQQQVAGLTEEMAEELKVAPYWVKRYHEDYEGRMVVDEVIAHWTKYGRWNYGDAEVKEVICPIPTADELRELREKAGNWDIHVRECRKVGLTIEEAARILYEEAHP